MGLSSSVCTVIYPTRLRVLTSTFHNVGFPLICMSYGNQCNMLFIFLFPFICLAWQYYLSATFPSFLITPRLNPFLSLTFHRSLYFLSSWLLSSQFLRNGSILNICNVATIVTLIFHEYLNESHCIINLLSLSKSPTCPPLTDVFRLFRLMLRPIFLY
jgi:hypothetical protein